MPKSLLFTIPAIMSNNSCSSTFIGALTASTASAFFSGLGRARLLTFWFWLRGMASICIVTAGTMYGGFSSRMKLLSASMSIFSSLTMYAAMNLPVPSPSMSKACTVASLMPGNSRMMDSTSFSSMRKPRIFTCPSLLPTNSMLPSGK